MGLQLTRGARPATPTVSGLTDVWLDSAGRLNGLGNDGFNQLLTELGVRSNLLANGGYDFAQRQDPPTLTTISNTSGRTYSLDRWGVTNENASVQTARIDNTGAGVTGITSRFYGQFKKITNAGKIIVSQVLEGMDTQALRGVNVRLQMKARNNVGSATLRLGLLQLTSAGTVDSIPATFASAFGATGTDPTWGTNLSAITPLFANANSSIVGAALTCVLTTAFQNFGGTFTVPATCKNLIVVWFTNGQPAINDIIEVAETGLFVGEEERLWFPLPYQEEQDRVQRYYSKTFNIDQNPIQNAGTNTGEFRFSQPVGASTACAGVGFEFPVRMRAAPATVTIYNPSVANAQIRRITATAADWASSTVTANGEQGCYVGGTSPGATAAGDQAGVHISADAEL